MISNILFSWLLVIAAKSVVLLSAVVLISLLLRRGSPSLRHLVVLLGICGTLSLPLSFSLPEWNIRYLPSVQNSPSLGQVRSDNLPAARESFIGATNQGSLRAIQWAAWVTGLWFLGMLALLIRLACALVLAYRLADGCTHARGQLALLAREIQAELGIKRRTSILIGKKENALPGPLTIGALRPLILLPKEADVWPEERLRTTLLHEFSHIRRNDFIWQVLARLGCAIYWFNPLIWFAARSLYAESEQAADDAVITNGVSRIDYAHFLLEAVRSLPTRSDTFVMSVAMARRSEVEVRILSLLAERKRRPHLRPQAIVLATIVAAALLIPFAALRPVAQSAVAQEVSAAEQMQNVTAANLPARSIQSAIQSADQNVRQQRRSLSPSPARPSQPPRVPSTDAVVAGELSKDSADPAHLPMTFNETQRVSLPQEVIQAAPAAVGATGATPVPGAVGAQGAPAASAAPAATPAPGRTLEKGRNQ
ncbi:MAG TPA: M56 family metallopeptidase [Pyrinomonadaceae bacterium]|nr:M56 family metallopeptidase [Pyrinomonadaceae bacterium]